MRYLYVFLAILGLGLPLAAQQCGDINRDYTINGNGYQECSPVVTLTDASTLNQSYTTLDPVAPVLLGTANAVVPNTFVTITNYSSVDLDQNTFQVAASGLGTNILSNLFWTDGSGGFSLVTGLSPNLPGLSFAPHMPHVAASSLDGFWVSQAHQVTFFPPFFCAFPGTNLGAIPARNFNEPLGFSYAFYGTTYTDIYINRDGNISFGSPESPFSQGPNVANLTGDAPRIAMLWARLVGGSGSLQFFTDNKGVAEVCFLNANPTNIINPTGNNNFNVVLDGAAGTITQSYDNSLDNLVSLVGMSPGSNFDPVGHISAMLPKSRCSIRIPRLRGALSSDSSRSCTMRAS